MHPLEIATLGEFSTASLYKFLSSAGVCTFREILSMHCFNQGYVIHIDCFERKIHSVYMVVKKCLRSGATCDLRVCMNEIGCLPSLHHERSAPART